MAEVLPFRGLRYNQQLPGGLNAQLAPPFDVISPTLQEDLYQRSPHNVVRLELGLTKPSDTDADNRYTRAQTQLYEWLQQEVLVQEATPAYYVCRHQFWLDGAQHVRWELLAQIRLASWEEGVVLPHERTLPEAKTDRLHLLRATETNISPVFSLYRDAEGELSSLLESTTAAAPIAQVDEWHDASFTIWGITDPAIQRKVQDFFAAGQLYIADGHHRYETALNYREERRSASGGNEQAGYNYVFMSLTRLEDQGLTVLPIHRLVRALPQERLDRMITSLADEWETERLPLQDASLDLPYCLERLRTLGEDGPAFTIYGATPGEALIVRPRDRASLLRRLPEQLSDRLRDLDLTLLHQIIIHGYMGIGQEAHEIEATLSFTHDAHEAIETVQQGTRQLAILVNPTRAPQIVAIAEAGETMPQKSTFFYPKLPTGLLMRPVENALE